MTEQVHFERIGEPVDPGINGNIQRRIWELMGRGFGVSNFPGMQPVSFHKSNIQNLLDMDYYVCEKTDGLRIIGLMQYHVPAHGLPCGYFYITDRNYSFRVLPVPFPLDPNGTAFHHDTIIDAELVLDMDQAPDGKKHPVLRLYIFDIMAFNGRSIVQENLNQRFTQVQNGIKRPFDAFYSANPRLAAAIPFRIRMKEMFKPYYIAHIFDNVVPKLPHVNDGLIFTPVEHAYTSGTCHAILKWKEKDQNTADFKVSVHFDQNRKPHFRLLVLDNHAHRPYDWLTLEPEYQVSWRQNVPDGRIIECRYDPTWKTQVDLDTIPSIREGGWRFVRFRDDKPNANEFRVLKNIIESISDSPSKEELVAIEAEIRKRWADRHK